MEDVVIEYVSTRNNIAGLLTKDVTTDVRRYEDDWGLLRCATSRNNRRLKREVELECKLRRTGLLEGWVRAGFMMRA
ncbi:hypothetical protein GN958_ATG00650 [Phytophthora infestans]|uniref:Uncharacterized protein n=1 Tax=Phytophthora infestans TaxID=4787 RepID=A0A8S9VFM9_PHYIN|nr:hypothetical protein GN958_ATG00650 [Phytophthora infestans]